MADHIENKKPVIVGEVKEGEDNYHVRKITGYDIFLIQIEGRCTDPSEFMAKIVLSCSYKNGVPITITDMDKMQANTYIKLYEIVGKQLA